MNNVESANHLRDYIVEKLPILVPGIFDTVPDIPEFTVDRGFMPLQDPITPFD
jgi:hypothetical protein